MIKPEELSGIDKSYFRILNMGQYTVTLQSMNTGRFWHLLERVGNGRRSFSKDKKNRRRHEDAMDGSHN